MLIFVRLRVNLLLEKVKPLTLGFVCGAFLGVVARAACDMMLRPASLVSDWKMRAGLAGFAAEQPRDCPTLVMFEAWESVLSTSRDFPEAYLCLVGLIHQDG